jgi:hypothetical protein
MAGPAAGLVPVENDPNRTLNGPSLYHLSGQGDQHSDLMSGEALDWSQTAEIAALFAGL